MPPAPHFAGRSVPPVSVPQPLVFPVSAVWPTRSVELAFSDSMPRTFLAATERSMTLTGALLQFKWPMASLLSHNRAVTHRAWRHNSGSTCPEIA